MVAKGEESGKWKILKWWVDKKRKKAMNKQNYIFIYKM